MSFLAALAPSVITAGANFLGSKMFGGGSGGGSSALANFKPTGISAGGLESTFGADGRVSIGATGARQGLVQSLAENFGGLAGQLGELRASVAPGISELRAQRLGEIENARTAAVGNLRENLQRRRVLGSSFGQDAITRAEAEFGGMKERAAAESFLQELELTTQFLDKEYAAGRQVFQTGLDEMNLQADIAMKLAGAATTQLGANARAEAELAAKEAAGAGKFFGETFNPVAKSLGTAGGDWLKSIMPKAA